MLQNLKYAAYWSITVGILIIVFAAMVGNPRSSRSHTLFSGGFVLLGCGCGILLLLPEPKGEVVQDSLGPRFGGYYEQNGLSFVPIIGSENCVATAYFHFQNRFERDCTAEILLVPLDGTADDGTVEVPAIVTRIEAPGSSVGLCKTPFAIAANWQGKYMIYKLTANVNYPNGTGLRVCDSEGMVCGTHRSHDNATTFRFKFGLGLGVLGIFPLWRAGIATDATIKLTLPGNVATELTPIAVTTCELFPSPGLGQPGFEVLPLDRNIP